MSQLFGGLCPLGEITVTTAGTPVQMTTNVGSQAQDGTVSTQNPMGRPFTGTCRQLIFSCPTANASDIYVQDGNHAGLGNYTLLIIPKGTTYSLPLGCVTSESQIDVTRYWIDAHTNGDIVFVTAVDAS